MGLEQAISLNTLDQPTNPRHPIWNSQTSKRSGHKNQKSTVAGCVLPPALFAGSFLTFRDLVEPPWSFCFFSARPPPFPHRGRRPTDHINRRILHSGSKAQYKGDASNHASQYRHVSVVRWPLRGRFLLAPGGPRAWPTLWLLQQAEATFALVRTMGTMLHEP